MCRVISSAWCWARKSAPPSARRSFKFCAETQRRMTTIATTKDAMAQAKTRMEKAVEDFRKELAALRTGRASVALLDHIRVDYHGTPMPINQLGALSVPEPTMIIVSPWDPGAVGPIDKAIRTSDLGRSEEHTSELQSR